MLTLEHCSAYVYCIVYDGDLGCCNSCLVDRVFKSLFTTPATYTVQRMKIGPVVINHSGLNSYGARGRRDLAG